MDKIEWNEIEDLVSGKSGQIKTKCPVCIDRRTNKSDRSLSVNVAKGVAKCHYCEAIGIRPDEQEINYTLPSQEWQNKTTFSDNFVKFAENRRISQQTLLDLKVTQEKYFIPQVNKEAGCFVFNYFEGDKIVNKKYRDSKKNFTQSKDGKPIFYNINSIIGQDSAYIVEGEFDVLALHEIGVKNVISVPNGANDNDNYWKTSEKYLADINKFYICTDNDEKGEILADKIAHRLGRYRCERVKFKNKDANGDLIDGGKIELENSLSSSTRYPASGTFTAEDIQDDILSLHKHGVPKTVYPKCYSFGNLKDAFTTMRGHLTVVTGIPSHGKSNFVEWYVLNLIKDYNMKASFYSPEHHPMALHQSTFIEKVFAKNFFFNNTGRKKVNEEEIKKYIKWSKERIYVTYPDDDRPTWKWLLQTFKEQVYSYGVDVFVIDAFNKVEMTGNTSELSQIRTVLTQLTNFAQQNDVMIFLIAHPTKMQKDELGYYKQPDLYNVSGSSDFKNITHNGLLVYRYFKDFGDYSKDDVVIKSLKQKMKFQGETLAEEVFRYDLPSGRYFSKSTTPNHESMMDDKYYKEPKIDIVLTEKPYLDVKPNNWYENDKDLF
ncbi:MAG: toprim domain-containing protein [Bacteroidia bacterium]|nr:toprim domain-containing protein [Bacteroidia bacterium]